MNIKDELANRTLGSMGYAQLPEIAKPIDVMNLDKKQLTCEQISAIEQVKEIGNNFHAYLGILGGLETKVNQKAIIKSQEKLEEAVMWAVKGICG